MERVEPGRLRDQSDWLRALARRLVGAGAAEDLAQDTMLRAIESPPAADRPVRPWLVRVLRNTARMRFRADLRRTRREAAVATAPDPAAPDASVQVLETHRALCELVLALDEPFRRTIVARYFDGLTLAQLARRDGVAEATVRWRHGRALTLIREALDQRAGGDRSAWTMALAPMLKAPAGTTTTLAALGGSLLNKLAVAALVASVSTATGVWWWRAARDADKPAPTASPPRPPAPTIARAAGALAAPSAGSGDPVRHVTRLSDPDAQRQALADRIAIARTRRAALAAVAPASPAPASDPAAAPPPAMDSPEHVLAQMMASLKEVRAYVSECVSHAETGTRGFNAALTLTGDPDIGTMIDASALSSLDGRPLPAPLDDCVREVLQALALPPMAIDDAFKVTYEFTFDDE
jgi:RNA polymerase sigma-70 factor (ECF subfamily)